jgi:hypothetical protein
MHETNYPQLMESLTSLINQRRYHDAEQLLADARAYARVEPPLQDVWQLVAEAAAYRVRGDTGRWPTSRELARVLTAAKLYPAATQPTVDNALERLRANDD